MFKNLSSLVVAVFLVSCLMAGFSFVYSLETPTDLVYEIRRMETDGFTILKEENDKDDFKNFIVSSDGRIVYFKAHYSPNQNTNGAKSENLISFDNEDKSNIISETPVSQIDQFIFMNEKSILFDGDADNKKGLFKVDLSTNKIISIKEVDIMSSIITKDLFIGGTSDILLSVDRNFKIKEMNTSTQYYFPLTFSGDYQGDINVVYKCDNGLCLGKLDEDLGVVPQKNLTKSETLVKDVNSLTFYYIDSSGTIAVTNDGHYSKILDGKPSYQTTIMENPIIGDKKSLYVILKGEVQPIDDSVMGLLINNNIGLYIKSGKILSFTVSEDTITKGSTIYEREDAVDVLTFNNGNIVFKTCSLMSHECSIKRIDESGKFSNLIVDSDTVDKGAWDFSISPLKYSEHEFAVLAYADSINPALFKFSLKPPVSCFNVKNTDSSVCSGNGECIETNVCKCFGNFEGQECEKCNKKFEGKYCNELKIHKCYGIPANSTNVCGGKKRGECVSENNCQCKAEYFEKECELTYCFGISSLDKKVCGGKGGCMDYNQCKCEEHYSGSMCEFYENTLISDRALYPIMITYGVISLVTIIGLVMLVFCFLGSHRKEYLALHGKRSIVSHHEPIIGGEDDEELDEPHFLEREHQEPTQTTPQNQEYALDESDEDL